MITQKKMKLRSHNTRFVIWKWISEAAVCSRATITAEKLGRQNKSFLQFENVKITTSHHICGTLGTMTKYMLPNCSTNIQAQNQASCVNAVSNPSSSLPFSQYLKLFCVFCYFYGKTHDATWNCRKRQKKWLTLGITCPDLNIL